AFPERKPFRDCPCGPVLLCGTVRRRLGAGICRARNFHRAHPACLPNHAEACHRRIHWWSEGVRRSPPPYREGMKNMQRRNARSTGVAALAAVALGLTACGGGGGGEDTLRI